MQIKSVAVLGAGAVGSYVIWGLSSCKDIRLAVIAEGPRAERLKQQGITINGTTYHTLPNTKGKILVSDQSSMFLSRPCNVADYGLIWAGVQKNVGPAGMVVVIIREDLIREDIDPKMPVYMSYKTHADNGSMYNTPNCWAIYCCGKVFKYLKSIGGLEEMHKRNIAKAKVIYDFLDSSKMFKGTVEPEFRSLMNIPFVTESAELDAEVVDDPFAYPDQDFMDNQCETFACLPAQIRTLYNDQWVRLMNN